MRKAIAYSVILVLICIFSCSFSESATAKLQELYAEAELKMVEGDYTGAADIFDRLGTYSDCSQMAMYCKAIAAAETLGLYDVAIDAFKKLGEFRDCQQLTVYYGGRSLEATADAVLNEISSFTDDDLEDTKTVL